MTLDSDDLKRKAYMAFLSVFNVVESDPDSRLEAISTLKGCIRRVALEVRDARRVKWAKETEENRIKPDNPLYGTHLRHCYGLNYDTADDGEPPNFRHSCKYGEDEICPAALFEDPWAEYLRWETEKSG